MRVSNGHIRPPVILASSTDREIPFSLIGSLLRLAVFLAIFCVCLTYLSICLSNHFTPNIHKARKTIPKTNVLPQSQQNLPIVDTRPPTGQPYQLPIIGPQKVDLLPTITICPENWVDSRKLSRFSNYQAGSAKSKPPTTDSDRMDANFPAYLIAFYPEIPYPSLEKLVTTVAEYGPKFGEQYAWGMRTSFNNSLVKASLAIALDVDALFVMEDPSSTLQTQYSIQRRVTVSGVCYQVSPFETAQPEDDKKETFSWNAINGGPKLQLTLRSPQPTQKKPGASYSYRVNEVSVESSKMSGKQSGLAASQKSTDECGKPRAVNWVYISDSLSPITIPAGTNAEIKFHQTLFKNYRSEKTKRLLKLSKKKHRALFRTLRAAVRRASNETMQSGPSGAVGSRQTRSERGPNTSRQKVTNSHLENADTSSQQCTDEQLPSMSLPRYWEKTFSRKVLQCLSQFCAELGSCFTFVPGMTSDNVTKLCQLLSPNHCYVHSGYARLNSELKNCQVNILSEKRQRQSKQHSSRGGSCIKMNDNNTIETIYSTLSLYESATGVSQNDYSLEIGYSSVYGRSVIDYIDAGTNMLGKISPTDVPKASAENFPNYVTAEYETAEIRGSIVEQIDNTVDDDAKSNQRFILELVLLSSLSALLLTLALAECCGIVTFLRNDRKLSNSQAIKV